MLFCLQVQSGRRLVTSLHVDVPAKSQAESTFLSQKKKNCQLTAIPPIIRHFLFFILTGVSFLMRAPGWTPEGQVDTQFRVLRWYARDNSYGGMRSFFKSFPDSLVTDEKHEKLMKGLTSLDWKVESAKAEYGNPKQPTRPTKITARGTLFLKNKEYKTLLTMNTNKSAEYGWEMDISPATESRNLVSDIPIPCYYSFLVCLILGVI